MDRARVRDLVEALLVRQPILENDPTFLRRALVVEGVSFTVSPVRLDSLLGGYGDVMATVLVRDAARRRRAGMLVFSEESDCLNAAEAEAEEAAARQGIYQRISRVDEEILQDSEQLLKDAVEQQSRRSSTAEAFRLMISRRYLEVDDQEDLHLRCLLLRMGEASTETPSHMYGVATNTLRGTGVARALVVYRSRRMAMVVFDDSGGIEHLARYDSGLFPLVADGAVGHGTAVVRDLLPLFCRSPEFLGRVVLLQEPGNARRDAGDLCHRIEASHTVEALMVHRAERIAVVVLRSGADARALMTESDQFWTLTCGRRPVTTLVGVPSQPFSPRQGLFPEAVNLAVAHIHARMLECSGDDPLGLGRGLVELESLRAPSFVRGGKLAQRPSSSWSYLLGSGWRTSSRISSRSLVRSRAASPTRRGRRH
ncbi:uncharacterized protein LOC102721468 [Oryza brachyantha]|uniref:uncharacterized protein LOC102721468 n=1 Tax=Oryza brachyantha TaxID=4533 RepID=UPI0007763EE9|nr:uncharacterized protein LOC102721468 [Oryza brachyantha]